MRMRLQACWSKAFLRSSTWKELASISSLAVQSASLWTSSFRGLNKAVDYTAALLGGPWPLHRSLWECDACRHQWPESTEKPPNNFLTSASSILLLVTALGWLIWVIAILGNAMSRATRSQTACYGATFW